MSSIAAGSHIETDLAESVIINGRTGRRVLFKMECQQPTGSFKLRGMSHLVKQRAAEGAKHFVCSSGGNAGIAVAYAGASLGIPVTVYLPSTSSPDALKLLAALGAETVMAGDVWDEADAAARAACAASTSVYVSPFNDPLLWEGHASMIDEAARQGPKPDALVVAVGGGGLMCGVLQGMHRNGWTDAPVIAAETEGAASFAAALAAGGPVTIPAITSIAKSLGAKRICDEAYAWTGRHEIRSAVVSDAEAVGACLTFANDLRVLVEPACGAALAVVEANHASLGDSQVVLVIACGGAAVNTALLQQWRQDMSAGL